MTENARMPTQMLPMVGDMVVAIGPGEQQEPGWETLRRLPGGMTVSQRIVTDANEPMPRFNWQGTAYTSPPALLGRSEDGRSFLLRGWAVDDFHIELNPVEAAATIERLTAALAPAAQADAGTAETHIKRVRRETKEAIAKQSASTRAYLSGRFRVGGTDKGEGKL